MKILSNPRAADRLCRSKAAAFSLTEVLVASAITSVVFVSLYAGIGSGFAAVESSRESLRAAQVILEKMETIRLYSWPQINTAGFVPATFTAPFNPASNSVAGFTYSGSVVITNSSLTEAYQADLKRVTVTVNWTSQNIARSRSMSTLVSQYGLQNYIY